MIHSDLLRQLLLASTAAIFIIFAAWALIRPRTLAKTLGYELSAPNGWSEFGAIYVGVFIAQALLCGLAISRVDDAVLGDLCAVFLLLQPAGRLLPLFRYGAPTGLLRLLMVLELFGGITLLLVRPGA